MKYIILAATFAALAPAHSATYKIFNNQAAPDTNGITNNAGQLLVGTTGFASFGFFSSDAAVTTATTAGELFDADWKEFGSSETSFLASSAPVNAKGLFSTQGSEVTNLADFTLNNIYLVIGHGGSSLADSDEFIVYKFDDKFADASEGVVNKDLVLNVDTYTPANLLLGEIGSDQLVTDFDGLAEPTFKTVDLVPEPSSTALLGLGGLALLLRRRR